ncbi:hypothetical protein [Arthrobacter sp. ISL-65]|uniref:hypothetical protein n=1 Tax=Arthrobacter sp. ISL-65 TaxID=2819112 RepID=UPI001BE855D5|nr:hypothetical protein [Arthrobacter sp. ISL-65]MBT2547725.1 hypothetical protein [Arthrobacter sp. ISL-65]
MPDRYDWVHGPALPLRQPGADQQAQDGEGKRLPPGQTNADQQVAGLAAATHYGEAEDPEAESDVNKPL